MRKRTIAVLCSAAALSLTVAPIAAASTDHKSPDTKRDRTHHIDKSRDSARDVRNR
jgi:hypothetical protein